ncbi:FecR domain-containing protein [Phyllobacterium sp. SB3]|uniref:FecR family protein n=1 Tax=Phyllobacterium sp. SB3 TaxID=3156073 RepID=UPI0032AEF1BA
MNEDEKGSDIDRRVSLDARDWIVRLTSGNVSDVELHRFRAWLDRSLQHRRAFERERTFWQQLQVLDGASPAASASRQPQRVKPALIGRRIFLAGGGATVAALGATIAMPRVELWRRADFRTGVGEQAEFSLPDGTIAALNTDSAIAVDFQSDLRLVELLSGEAEFRVQPGLSSIFRVAALGGNSDTLGTTFFVQVINGRATVAVAEGRVRVTGPVAPHDHGGSGADEVELGAEEQTQYSRGERPYATMPIDTDAALAWRTGRIIFEGRPFVSAIAELGRYLPERIVVAPGVDTGVPVSAVFSTREVWPAVQALARTQGLSTRRVPGIIVMIS